MKFVSKYNNYRVVLKPGLPESKITGTPAVSAIFVKFESGMAEVNDEGLVEQLMNHPRFGSDFVLAEGEKDPYQDVRGQIEPEHDITEIKYGSVGKTLNSPSKVSFSKEQLEVIKGLLAIKDVINPVEETENNEDVVTQEDSQDDVVADIVEDGQDDVVAEDSAIADEIIEALKADTKDTPVIKKEDKKNTKKDTVSKKK